MPTIHSSITEVMLGLGNGDHQRLGSGLLMKRHDSNNVKYCGYLKSLGIFKIYTVGFA